MINIIINEFKNMDKKIWNIIVHGLKFSFVLCLIAIFILINYKLSPIYIDTYYIGIKLFKASFTFAIEFIICGLATNIITNGS